MENSTETTQDQEQQEHQSDGPNDDQGENAAVTNTSEPKRRKQQIDSTLQQTIDDIVEYRENLAKVLRDAEKLKIEWVEKTLDFAYLQNWREDANLAYRKLVLMDWRLRDIKGQRKKKHGE